MYERRSIVFNQKELLIFSQYHTNGIEMRGIWHMPNSLSKVGYDETTLEGVCKLLDKIKDAGYNTILIETVNAYTVYPSKTSTVRHDLDFSDNRYGDTYQNDYLKCFIGEAHKRGIKVHAWTTTMRAGRFSNTLEESLPKAIKPEWLARGYHNEYGLNGRYGELMWLDASNPEVISYLLNQYEELILNYDLDGIELDAIRYPISNLYRTYDEASISDFGYTKMAIDSFKEKYHYDGDLKKEIIDNEKLKNDWIEFRRDLITNIVHKIVKLILRLKPEMPISAAVFVNYQNAVKEVCQDWKLWVEKGWLDFVSPMAYSTDNEVVKKSYQETENYCKNICFNLQGIATIIEGGDYLSHFSQMDLINQDLGLGSILFSIRQFLQDEKTYEMVKYVYNTFPAISPISKLEEIFAFQKGLLKSLLPEEYHPYLQEFTENNLYDLDHNLRILNNEKVNNIIKALIKTVEIQKTRKNIRQKLIKTL